MYILSLSVQPFIAAKNVEEFHKHQNCLFIYDMVLLVGGLGLIAALYGTGALSGAGALKIGIGFLIMGVVDALIFLDLDTDKKKAQLELEAHDRRVEELLQRDLRVQNSQTLQNYKLYLEEAREKGRMICKPVYPDKKEEKGNRLIFTPGGRIVLHFPGVEIGEGGSKKVTAAVDLLSGEELIYACWKGDEEEKGRQENEMGYLKQFENTPGFVPTIEVCIVKKGQLYHFHMLQPRYNQGALVNYVSQLDMSTLFIPFSLQILEGLRFLLQRGLFHSDIKVDNILVHQNEDGSYRIDISDLAGISPLDEQGEEMSPYFLPPESWAFASRLWSEEENTTREIPPFYRGYNEKRMVYTMGILLYILNQQAYPNFIQHQIELDKEGNEETRAQFKHQDWQEAYQRWHQMMEGSDDPVGKLMTRMTAEDPNDRPTIEEVIGQLEMIKQELQSSDEEEKID